MLAGSLVLSLSALASCVLWTYWPTLLNMADRWSHDPQYSHGFLVPIFAAVILWQRRSAIAFRPGPMAGNSMEAGWALLLTGVVIRCVGTFGGVQALDAISLLPSLGGLCLLVGGWASLRWAWPAIAFLAFMLPLPFVAETALAQPLQRLATVACTFALQTLGYPALAEGNIIYMDEIKLGVIGACSGLGMLMTFFALSTAMAVVVKRPLADKLVIAASAIPIAVIANVARITATGIVCFEWGQEMGNVLHDLAGWSMMPLALALLWLELQFCERLLIPMATPAPIPLQLIGSACFSEADKHEDRWTQPTDNPLATAHDTV
jgi:exosortase